MRAKGVLARKCLRGFGGKNSWHVDINCNAGTNHITTYFLSHKTNSWTEMIKHIIGNFYKTNLHKEKPVFRLHIVIIYG